jgi:plasmid stabilization system protein ParE
MTHRVVIQPRAERDLREAVRWILERSKSPATAARWVRGIRARIATLASHPGRCPVDPDSAAYGADVRVLLYGKKRGTYRILFAIERDAVRVLTIRHSARRGLAEEGEDDPGGLP